MVRKCITLEEFLYFLQEEFKLPFTIYDVVEKFPRTEGWIRGKIRLLITRGEVKVLRSFLTDTQKGYLRKIAKNYGLEKFTCKDVTELMNIHRSAAQTMLEKLVSMGYLQREKTPSRRVYYTLTPHAILALYVSGEKRDYYITKQALNSLNLEELIEKI